MNNPNPFVPKGSILEQQSKRRSRLKLTVLCVIAIGVAGLTAMLIQGCKREQPSDTGDNSTPAIDTNTTPVADTNTEAMDTNMPPYVPPAATNPPVEMPAVVPAETEYVVVKGDTLGKIAKKNGVTVKALEAANPGVIPTKLKIGQKLSIPAGGSSTTSMDATGTNTGDEIYVVKSGDTLTRIARHYGVTFKAIESENNLSTSNIKVGQKLKIPAKPEAAAPPVVAPAPVPVAPEPVPTNSTDAAPGQ